MGIQKRVVIGSLLREVRICNLRKFWFTNLFSLILDRLEVWDFGGLRRRVGVVVPEKANELSRFILGSSTKQSSRRRRVWLRNLNRGLFICY